MPTAVRMPADTIHADAQSRPDVRLGCHGIREAVGKNSLTLVEVVWDIAEFKGRKGVLRIVDSETGSWGIIAADHFVFSSDSKPKFPTGGRPKPKASGNLVRVPGEGTAALVPGATLKETGGHKATGVTSPTAIAFGNDGSLYEASAGWRADTLRALPILYPIIEARVLKRIPVEAGHAGVPTNAGFDNASHLIASVLDRAGFIQYRSRMSVSRTAVYVDQGTWLNRVIDSESRRLIEEVDPHR